MHRVFFKASLTLLLIALAHMSLAEDEQINTAFVAELSQEELSELVAPVALYPDDLIAIVLPAST